MRAKIVKVGIMSFKVFQKYTKAIASGKYKPQKNAPKIWFESLQSFAQLLSDDNRALLQVIEEQKPNSLRELEEMTGRKRSNLSRTLHTMANYGIVELVQRPTRELTPIVRATHFKLEVGIG